MGRKLLLADHENPGFENRKEHFCYETALSREQFRHGKFHLFVGAVGLICVGVVAGVGDYEVDTIVGAAHSQHILTLNDRKTGKLWLRKLANPTAFEAANENTNGLVRQYIPKGSDFKNITQEFLEEVEKKLFSKMTGLDARNFM